MCASVATASADLHIHTTGSDGLGTPAAVLAEVARRGDLALIAITDHDDLAPALRSREIHAQRGCPFAFVPGMEVTTLEGHLLALFIEEQVPSFRSLPATLDRIHAQGGLAIIPHPLSPLTRSIGRHGIERILARRADGLWFDGIELANPSPAGRLTAAKAQRLNRERFHLAEVGGSDAHYLQTLGTAFTRFPGSTAADLRAAIAAGETCGALGRAVSLRELGARRIVRQTGRAMWATPSKVLGRPLSRLQRLGAGPAGARGS
jgi:predicted metal-dependent phosphoesterase TrpH